ncbi:MAG: trehalose-phosphatase [Candidatus Omnitrophota bacterium]|jgi:trehalose-phosphatase
MKHLFKNWEKVRKEIAGKYLMLFLDYDGTLAPIVDRPEDARIPVETREALERLSKIRDCKISIISGRALEDISKRVGIKNIIYSGNHGLEIEGPKIRFKHSLSCGYGNLLRNIEARLKERLSSERGVFIENKGLSLTLHFRLAKKEAVSYIKTVFHEVVILYLLKNKIKIRPGKKVLEIRPPIEWDKGKILLWLLARQQASLGDVKILPIYAGDDITDEDAFEVLEGKGLTIFIGKPGNSQAAYYLKNTKEALELLNRIVKIKSR